MKKHLRRKHSDIWKTDKHPCSFCGKEFSEKYTRDEHESIHTQDYRFTCNKCGKGFNYKISLDNHMACKHREASEKNFQCTECGKFFGTKQTLEQHIRTHVKNKELKVVDKDLNESYQCPDCGTLFPTLKGLRGHQINSKTCHLETKPFSCSECGLRYSTETRLAVHMRSHTGETPFQCEKCAKKFKFLYRLNNHTKNHCK